MNATTLQKFSWAPLVEAGVRSYLVREDLTHAQVPGPKFLRLDAGLAQAIEAGALEIVTAGGMQSNHLHGLAILAKEQGIKCQAYVRGLAHLPPNALLLDCQELGMRLTPTSFAEFDRLNLSSANPNLLLSGGQFFIPMGADTPAGHLATKHMAIRWQGLGPLPDWLVLSAGTGATLRGVSAVWPLHGRLLVVAPFKDASFLLDGLPAENLARIHLANYPKPLRFGRISADMLEIVKDFQAQVPLCLDNLYMPRVLQYLHTNAAHSLFKERETVWIVHCGGARMNLICPE